MKAFMLILKTTKNVKFSPANLSLFGISMQSKYQIDDQLLVDFDKAKLVL